MNEINEMIYKVKGIWFDLLYGKPRPFKTIYERYDKKANKIEYSYALKRPRGTRVCRINTGVNNNPGIVLEPGESLFIPIDLDDIARKF